MEVEKVIIFSVLVSANVVVWYEAFGIGFLCVMAIIIACMILFPRRWKK